MVTSYGSPFKSNRTGVVVKRSLSMSQNHQKSREENDQSNSPLTLSSDSERQKEVP